MLYSYTSFLLHFYSYLKMFIIQIELFSMCILGEILL